MTASSRTPVYPSPSVWWRTVNLARRAVKIELRIYESLWRALAKRPVIPAQGHGFAYHRPVLTVLMIFMVLSAIEIPILDAIVRRWLPVRIFFLVLGFWGLTWMIGLLCAYLTRPHTVSPEGIRVREGLELDIPVAWDDFASIRRRDTAVDPNDPDRVKGRVFFEGDDTVCAVRMSHETNLEVHFERPTEIRLPGLHPKGGIHEITVLRFWADNPVAFLDSVRQTLGER